MDRYEPVTKALAGHAAWNEEDLTPLALKSCGSMPWGSTLSSADSSRRASMRFTHYFSMTSQM